MEFLVEFCKQTVRYVHFLLLEEALQEIVLDGVIYGLVDGLGSFYSFLLALPDSLNELYVMIQRLAVFLKSFVVAFVDVYNRGCPFKLAGVVRNLEWIWQFVFYINWNNKCKAMEIN